tara:strand:- start:3428 stop:4051 length:624 start_codon:yes stop_codon:yes gene_type:complete
MVVAMWNYPGGTYRDATTKGYLLSQNFLSDLGRWSAWNGDQNFYSSFFFGMAFVGVGVVCTLFFLNLPYLFSTEKRNHSVSRIGSAAGVVGAVFLAGVGFTPGDIAFDAHIFFANWFIRFFLAAAFFYTIVFYRSEIIEARYASGYALFALLIAIYILILEFGPNIQQSLWALKVQVIAQKIICFTFIFSVAFQTVGNAKAMTQDSD